MAVEPWVLEPDLVRYVGLLNAQWPRLQQRKADLVERPFDLDRQAEHRFGLAHQPAESCRLAGGEAWRAGKLARHRLRRSAGPVHAALAMVFAAGCVAADKSLAR